MDGDHLITIAELEEALEGSTRFTHIVDFPKGITRARRAICGHESLFQRVGPKLKATIQQQRRRYADAPAPPMCPDCLRAQQRRKTRQRRGL